MRACDSKKKSKKVDRPFKTLCCQEGGGCCLCPSDRPTATRRYARREHFAPAAQKIRLASLAGKKVKPSSGTDFSSNLPKEFDDGKTLSLLPPFHPLPPPAGVQVLFRVQHLRPSCCIFGEIQGRTIHHYSPSSAAWHVKFWHVRCRTGRDSGVRVLSEHALRPPLHLGGM